MEKVYLTGTQETLLITLYAKALDYRSKKSVLHDKKADEIIQSIEYDFGKFKGFGNQAVIPLRARQYDEWVRAFLRKNPTAVVLNLGCGLDTRVSRIQPSQTVHWYDVDFPDVVEVRKKFYKNSPAYTMLSHPLVPTKWLAEVPKERPVLIIAEGVLEYLTAEQVKTLFKAVNEHFSRGQIAFDVMTPYAIQSARTDLKNKTGAVHKWAVENLEEVDALAPHFKNRRTLPLFTSQYRRLLPWKYRLLCMGLAIVPHFREMLRLLKYDF